MHIPESVAPHARAPACQWRLDGHWPEDSRVRKVTVNDLISTVARGSDMYAVAVDGPRKILCTLEAVTASPHAASGRVYCRADRPGRNATIPA